jgi:hypothetical protein
MTEKTSKQRPSGLVIVPANEYRGATALKYQSIYIESGNPTGRAKCRAIIASKARCLCFFISQDKAGGCDGVVACCQKCKASIH